MIRASGDVGNAYSLSDEAAELIETLPDAARNFRQTLREEGVTSPNAMAGCKRPLGSWSERRKTLASRIPKPAPAA
jgi:hypothetical protein